MSQCWEEQYEGEDNNLIQILRLRNSKRKKEIPDGNCWLMQKKLYKDLSSFLASQDALEVMRVTELLSYWVTKR